MAEKHSSDVHFYVRGNAGGFRYSDAQNNFDSGAIYRGTDPWELARIGYEKHINPHGYKRGPKHQPRRSEYKGNSGLYNNPTREGEVF